MIDDTDDNDDLADFDLETLDVDVGGDPENYTLPDGSNLSLARAGTGWKLFFTPSPSFTTPTTWQPSPRYSAEPILLAESSDEIEGVITYPTVTTWGRDSFLEPKYDQLRAISIEGGPVEHPGHIAHIVQFISDLPAGFTKEVSAGFGLHSALNYLIATIEQIDGVTRLHVGERSADQEMIGDGVFHMTFAEYDAARRAIDSIHRKALRAAAEQKRIHLNNSILHSIDPVRFPTLQSTYRSNAIRDAVGSNIAAKARLSSADEDALVKIVKASAEALVKSRPADILELEREIEVVTLRTLIERMEELLGKQRGQESLWQEFFLNNSFVLRRAFGFPVAVIGDSVSVGGRQLDGSGGKVADFAARAISTGNIVLVEIKTPATLIVEPVAYRGGLHGPHRELTAAVSQVMDQRYRLQSEIHTLRSNSRRHDIETYAVQCLVIAGQTPDDPDKQKSLELYRHSLHGVAVITYDELLAKLKQLLEFLQPSAGEQPPATEEPPSDPAATEIASDPLSGLT